MRGETLGWWKKLSPLPKLASADWMWLVQFCNGIMKWQAVVGLEEGVLIIERPDASPNPTVEVRES